MLKAPFEDFYGDTVKLKKYFLPNENSTLFNAKDMHQIMSSNVNLDSVRRPFDLSNDKNYLKVYVQADSIKIGEERVVTAMAAYIPDDKIEGKKTACKTFIPIQPFKNQRQAFKQLKKFRNTEVHGWACKDRYDFT